MSSTNKTPNYELPQFIGTDIPTWLGDFNGAMSDIDTALKTNADRADLASTQAGQAVNTANAANDAVSALQTVVTGLGNRVTGCEETDSAQSTQISGLSSSVASLDGRVTTLEQSGTGGHSYRVASINLGSFSGNSIDRSTQLTCATDSQINAVSDLFIGEEIEINFGTYSGKVFVGADVIGDSLKVTIPVMPRIYTNATVAPKLINLELSACSGGLRGITYISCIGMSITSGNTASGTTTAGSIEYNTNGISGTISSVDINVTGKYLYQY